MANIRYNGMQPINRYSLNQRVLPGQYKRLGGTNLFTNKTFIQNNFYGGCSGQYDYGSFGCDGQCNDSGDKFMNWMMGIGAGATIVGTLFKLLFGKEDGDVEGKGGDNPKKTADPNEALKKENEALKKKIEQLEQKTVEPKVTKKKVEPPKVETSPFDMFKDGLEMVCHDNSDKTKDISGQLSQVKGEAGKAPTSFVITDTSSGTSNAYKYEATGEADKNGNPIYKCVSKNNVPISGSSEYTFVNGKLVQYDNQPNYRRGMKFGTQASTVGSANSNVTIPEGWGKPDSAFLNKLKQNNSGGTTVKSADDVATEYLSHLGLKADFSGPLSPDGVKANLIDEIVRLNPSLYSAKGSNGVKQGATYEKLDLPSAEWLKNNGFIEDSLGKNKPSWQQ